MYPQTKDTGRDTKTERRQAPPERGMDIVMTGAPAKCPPNFPMRVLLDLASFEKDRPLPVPSAGRGQSSAQKFHLQCTLHCPQRSFHTGVGLASLLS